MTDLPHTGLECGRCHAAMAVWSPDARLLLCERPQVFIEKLLCVDCQMDLRAWFEAGTPLRAEAHAPLGLDTHAALIDALDAQLEAAHATPYARHQKPHALPRLIK